MEKINIITVKWGDKFDASFVNRLYTMVAKNTNYKFDFYCLTEDPTNIREEVKILPLELSIDLEKWWWKMCIFNLQLDGIKLFLDLDLVIQNNIDSIFKSTEKLTTIKCYWKEIAYEENILPEPPGYNMPLNSSIMLWKSDLSKLWQNFYADPEHYMMKYIGIDSYLYFNEYDNLNFFEPGVVYSRLHGYDLDNRQFYPSGKLFYKENYLFCIFNKYNKVIDFDKRFWIDDTAYDGFEKYWQT